MSRPKGEIQAEFILRLLCASPHPMSAYDLLKQARSEGISSPIIIYRALKKLLAAGSVQRVASQNAFVAYKDVSSNHAQSIGIAICAECGRTSEFRPPQAFAHLRADGSVIAFTPNRIVVEVSGICASTHYS